VPSGIPVPRANAQGIFESEMMVLLRIRDFRLLFIGEGVSLLGDQFYFIALPWLVLELSHDPFALGVMLALQGLPRALFMLVGGAVTDRFSPRRVMIGSNVARLALVGLLAALVLSGSVQLWMLWPIVFAFGVADGFFFPAQSAIVPRLAATEQLPAANAVVQGLDQVAQFVGPMLAGALIAAFAAGRLGLDGVGLALAVDAATFVVSVVTLGAMHVDRVPAWVEAGAPPRLWASIREGFGYMWRDPLLRTLLALIVAVNFLAVGPLLVGIPQLVRERLSEGAGGFGLVMSAFGAGSLVGLALGGTLPKPPPRVTGSLLLAVCVVFGLGLAVLGFAHTLVAALLPALLMGLAVGYLMVFFFSWVQARTPQRMMGRMMSLVIFASVGLVPLSQLVSGAVARWSVTALFVGAAVLLGLVVARAWFVPALRAMGVEMATGDARALALADARGRVRGETTETRDVR
jgi:MFS family permease